MVHLPIFLQLATLMASHPLQVPEFIRYESSDHKTPDPRPNSSHRIIRKKPNMGGFQSRFLNRLAHEKHKLQLITTILFLHTVSTFRPPLHSAQAHSLSYTPLTAQIHTVTPPVPSPPSTSPQRECNQQPIQKVPSACGPHVACRPHVRSETQFPLLLFPETSLRKSPSPINPSPSKP